MCLRKYIHVYPPLILSIINVLKLYKFDLVTFSEFFSYREFIRVFLVTFRHSIFPIKDNVRLKKGKNKKNLELKA